VHAQILMTSLMIHSDDVTGASHAQAELTIVTRWHDPRLFCEARLNPCCDETLMADMISLRPEEAAVATHVHRSDERMENFWMPALLTREQDEASPTVLVQRVFQMSQPSSAAGGGGENEEGETQEMQHGRVQDAPERFSAVLAEKRSVAVAQPQFDMTYFPFDVQDVTFVMQMPIGATLPNCSSAFALKDDALAHGSDWTITRHWSYWTIGAARFGSRESTSALDAESVLEQLVDEEWDLTAPRNGTGGSHAPGACVLKIRIVRIPNGFIISNMVPTFLVVFGGLGAMWLDPAVPPLMGGRVSLMIVAMLVVVNMGRAHKLRLSTTMWKDWLTIVQVSLLLVGLLATLTVHMYARSHQVILARTLDENMRHVAWVTYVGFLLSVICFGTLKSPEAFAAIGTATLAIDALILTFNGYRLRRIKRRKRADLMKALLTVDLKSNEGTQLAQQFFQDYDEDNSDSISTKEATEIIIASHGGDLRLAKAYAKARTYTKDDGHLFFPQFLDMLEDLQNEMANRLGDEGEEKGTLLDNISPEISSVLSSMSRPMDSTRIPKLQADRWSKASPTKTVAVVSTSSTAGDANHRDGPATT